MSRNLKIAVGALGGVLLFSAGLVAGWRAGQRAPSVPPAALPGTTRAMPDVESAKPATPPAEPRVQAGTQSSPAMVRLAAVMELYRGARGGRFSILLLHQGSTRVNPDFAEAFDLTPVEKQELESATARAKAELGQVEAATARFTPRAEGGFMVSIAPYPKEGGEIYDRFIASVEGVLGPERTGYFREMHSADSEQLFDLGRFGLMQTDIEVVPRPVSGMTSSLGTTGDPRPGVFGRNGFMEWGVFRDLFPAVYERMRREGLTPDGKGP